MPVGDILPELSLILGAAIILVSATFLPRQRHLCCTLLALMTLAVAMGLTLDQWSLTNQLSFKTVWAIDRGAVIAKSIILAATFICVLLSPQWLNKDRRHGEYYTLVLFTALGAIVLASANGSMELIMGVLLSSAASYPLVAFHRNWAPSTEAGMKYFLAGALANAILLVGVVLLFGLVGDTAYGVIHTQLAARADPWILTAGFACVLTGLCFKLAAFPLHTWMPDVAQGAPVPVAALLSVVPKIGAAVALARFVQILPVDFSWPALLACVAAATMTLGNLAAVWQKDMRRLLGWSSVSQSGYALMAVTVLNRTDSALPALLVFLAGYATANLALFAAVTALRGRTDFADYAGLSQKQPAIALVIVVSFLSLVGIPPLFGFFGKLALFSSTIEGRYLWLAVLAIANTVISLFYYLRLVQIMYFKAPEQSMHLLGKLSWGTTLAMGIGVLALGLAAQGVLALINTVGFATGNWNG
ncbi:NADH-quinone oxidoreductase subunit N [Bowmanella dokdonensis]|uniref:NADH-quinone oxidoreductase subunit N n=1 Tax=Bowmanella dokdonensis TaxID=751969 RepID=A0A939DKF8_9ALTE|nr:NADH-quinone oxidoreductase subunit N [Bowmanella dokdonensis]MBN7824287.1 NADH-quinone oxidoreductase subunit N [Bowmanella dokdonensis]